MLSYLYHVRSNTWYNLTIYDTWTTQQIMYILNYNMLAFIHLNHPRNYTTQFMVLGVTCVIHGMGREH